MSGSRAPEELREMAARALVSADSRMKGQEELLWHLYLRDVAAVFGVIEARYPGCWETLERSRPNITRQAEESEPDQLSIDRALGRGRNELR